MLLNLFMNQWSYSFLMKYHIFWIMLMFNIFWAVESALKIKIKLIPTFPFLHFR